MIDPYDPHLNFPGLPELREVYQEVDTQILLFKDAARIECLKGCQECCHSARYVEVSPFEMLPLGIHLWKKGGAEAILKQLEEVDPEGPCILLNRNPSPFSGGCGYYPFRPLLCRLFGFSAVLDKYGTPKIALCKSLKQLNPGIADRINEMIQKGLQVPILSQYSRRVAFIHPRLGQVRHSLNFSLKQALEIIGYRLTLPSPKV
jgi:Fe-S-cluster containining protein